MIDSFIKHSDIAMSSFVGSQTLLVAAIAGAFVTAEFESTTSTAVGRCILVIVDRQTWVI